MATQWMTVATFAGESAIAVAAQFERWRSACDPEVVDAFCLSLQKNALSLSVVYFAQWIDRWLMGDQVPGPGSVDGRRFCVTCFSPNQAKEWAGRCGSQFAEQTWFAVRLREAAVGWGPSAEPYAVVIVREVVGGSAIDEEVWAAARQLPEWLSSLKTAEPTCSQEMDHDKGLI